VGTASHYIGLYGWTELSFSDNDRVFCDSLALLFMARIFGFKLNYLPGAKSLADLDSKSLENVYLAPFFLDQFPKDLQITLPMLKTVDVVPQCTLEWLNSKSKFKRIYVGISTPNQNALGSLLASKYDASIHCVGAAIIEAGTPEFKLVSKASGSGFEWFYRAIKSPSRFYTKVRVIIRELLRIIFDSGVRARFKVFLEMVDEVNR
jgi:hypothetical protein|tara:strand:- start:1082 stop:1699 length:618 start_codon:yes stop_codon:yes gene_type:complete